MKSRNLSRGGIFFILSLGDFEETLLDFPNFTENLTKNSVPRIYWVILQLLHF